MNVFLRLEDVASVEGFHDLLATAFSFPQYYGRNLDAFEECFLDVKGALSVRISALDSLESSLRKFVERYIAVMREFEAESGGRIEIVIE